MKNVVLAGFLAASAAVPAAGDPLADASFVTGVSICINFGSDGWFAQDRLEGAGWVARYDADYGVTVYDSPEGKVQAIPPAEGAGFPAWCSVVSQEVALDFAADVVRRVLIQTGVDANRETVDGCLAYRTAYDQQIRVHNDGNEVMCNRPDSARVDVITLTDPVGAQ